MKLELLKREVINSISEDFNLKLKGEYNYDDVIMFAESNGQFMKTTSNIFSSYIYSILNIYGEIQGSMISWEQSHNYKNEENIQIQYNEFGFIKKVVSATSVNSSEVMMYVMNNLGEKEYGKLLVK